jgi:hypothetical protein
LDGNQRGQQKRYRPPGPKQAKPRTKQIHAAHAPLPPRQWQAKAARRKPCSFPPPPPLPQAPLKEGGPSPKATGGSTRSTPKCGHGIFTNRRPVLGGAAFLPRALPLPPQFFRPPPFSLAKARKTDTLRAFHRQIVPERSET